MCIKWNLNVRVRRQYGLLAIFQTVASIVHADVRWSCKFHLMRTNCAPLRIRMSNSRTSVLYYLCPFKCISSPTRTKVTRAAQ